MIKKFQQFITEETQNDFEKQEVDVNLFDDIKEELVDIIEKSLNSTDEKVVNDFISSYLSNPDENQIEGLINDSDVYDFYLKFRNDIDEILSTINFYDETPSELGSFSLYDYVIKGTKKAIEEVLTKIKGQ